VGPPEQSRFLYRDDETIDDFLSQVEGGIVEGAYSEKDVTTSGKEGGLSLTLLGTGIGASGKGNRATSIEIERQIRDNPQAKFARLYKLLTDEDLLDEEDRLWVLNGFDMKVYEEIGVGKIIEVRGVGALPQWEHFKQSMADLQGTIGLMKAIGQDPTTDPENQTLLNQLTQLAAISSDENTILSVTPIGAPNIKIVAKLEGTKLHGRPKSALETEVTILGKVQRRLQKTEKIELFRLLPNMKGFEQLIKAGQPKKGPRGRIERPNTESPIDEYIKYPAVEVLPVAIYL
jgi:hypothetical protein